MPPLWEPKLQRDLCIKLFSVLLKPRQFKKELKIQRKGTWFSGPYLEYTDTWEKRRTSVFYKADFPFNNKRHRNWICSFGNRSLFSKITTVIKTEKYLAVHLWYLDFFFPLWKGTLQVENVFLHRTQKMPDLSPFSKLSKLYWGSHSPQTFSRK